MKLVFTYQEAIKALRKEYSIPKEETVEIEWSLWGTYTPIGLPAPFYAPTIMCDCTGTVTTASTPMCTGGTILN